MFYFDKIIIIINSYTFVTLIRSTHKKLYAMCVEWTKLFEIENHSLFIRLLHAVEMTRLRLCIKFVHVDCMLENECSSHFKLLQKFRFHHHSYCCSEIFRDRRCVQFKQCMSTCFAVWWLCSQLHRKLFMLKMFLECR